MDTRRLPQEDVSELGYELAVTELEALVTALQRDEVAVDELEARLARGAALVAHCRERLARAELAVEEVAELLLASDGAEQDGRPVPGTAPAEDRDVPF